MTTTTKILLVDDEQDILDLLSYNFKKQGYEVHTALDGNEAIIEVSIFHPDIIVSDILMPNTSGIKMCRLLKADERYKNIPVIFLSASNDDYLALSSLDAGAIKYLSKPVHIPILFDLVKSVVKH
ncbi:hypothetical protein LBMAG27_16170 [Bacteroidota bacterium]|nr:hypothetical protein LBMAG27_16170 [Bacteroidota bacterium]